ncbi:MAG: glycosyltransferase family 2 protein [Elusimicrobia bacterium]|nr:glycosyltransferase family 2 protein [Elusimicrobiota bacterium]
MKLSIIVPVFNERATVRALLDQVLSVRLAGIEKEIVIVEGNSTDGTREAAREYEGKRGVRVLYEEAPRGKGAAVRAGLAAVTGDVLLIQDGDLEYSTDDYPAVLEPLRQGRCEIVFGTRTSRSAQSWQFRRYAGLERVYGFFVNLGGVLFTGLFNLLYGTRLTDGATMFKVFRVADLRELTLRSDGFDYDWEISGKLVRAGCRIEEVPVSYKARSRAEGKKIRFFRDGIRVAVAIFRYRFFD